MRQDILVLLKKNFFIWVSGSPGRGSQSGGDLCFLTKFDGSWTPIQLAKMLAQTLFQNYMISRVNRALAWLSSMSGTKVTTQKPHFTPKFRKIRKCMSLPLAAWYNRDNSPPKDANELYVPSKDSWSLLACTEKKKILDLGSVFSVGGVRKRVVLAFFDCFFMTSSPPQRAKFLVRNLGVF